MCRDARDRPPGGGLRQAVRNLCRDVDVLAGDPGEDAAFERVVFNRDIVVREIEREARGRPALPGAARARPRAAARRVVGGGRGHARPLAPRPRAPSLRHEAVLNSVGDAIVTFDGEGRVVYSNPAATALSRERDIVGARRTLPASRSPVMQTLRDGEPRSGAGAPMPRKDGTQALVDFTVTPLLRRGADRGRDRGSSATSPSVRSAERRRAAEHAAALALAEAHERGGGGAAGGAGRVRGARVGVRRRSGCSRAAACA